MNEIVSHWVMPGIPEKPNQLLQRFEMLISAYGGISRVYDIIHSESIKTFAKYKWAKSERKQNIYKPWKQEHIDFTMFHYKNMKHREIGLIIGRSDTAIGQLVYYQTLKRNNKKRTL